MILTGILIISISLYIFSETEYKFFGIILLGIGLNCFTTYYKLQNIKESNQMTKWKNKLALVSFENLKKEFDMPTYRLNQENGLAIWNKTSKQKIYDEILIKDEDVVLIDKKQKHHIHNICTYFKIKIYIPSKNLNEILQMSSKISYNKIKYMVTIYTTDINNSNKLLLEILKKVNSSKNSDLIKKIKFNFNKFKFEMETLEYN